MKRSTRRGLLVLGILAAATARAGADRWQGGALLHYEASYVHRRGDAAPMIAGDGLAMAGLRLKGFVSRTLPVGYLIGFDLQAGSTNPGGFAYQTNLYLLGMGARLGDLGTAGIGAGVGVSGALRTVDDAVGLPIEAFFELGVGSRLRLLGRARAVWLAGADDRGDGAPNFGFADEVDATLCLRLGRRYRELGFPSGNGYFVGAAYREWLGAPFVGAVIGYSVDVGSR